jgi:hypothetical protein
MLEGRSSDIYHLLERDDDGFALDMSFLHGYERKAGATQLPADAVVRLHLGETGFSLQDPDRLDPLVDEFSLYCDLVQHAVITHTLVGAGITLSSRTNLPQSSPLRRALMPTELGVLNGVGRALQVLVGKHTGLLTFMSNYTYPALKQMVRDRTREAVSLRVKHWSGPVFAPHLRLSEHELSGDNPLRLLREWHTSTRSFAARVVAMDVAYGTSDEQRRRWVQDTGLDPDTCDPVDVLAAAYMNTLFHSLQDNEESARLPPRQWTCSDVAASAIRYTNSGGGYYLELVPTLRLLDTRIFGRFCDDLCGITSVGYPQYTPSTVKVSVGF